MLRRRHSVEVSIEGVRVGGENPIVVQSMTNTSTADIDATVAQVQDLVEAGSEIVRITVDTDQAARAVPGIIEREMSEWVAIETRTFSR
jgi:(E)-4-hydroxy-3-methylbut-2-enyl-diphosphate synthase